MEQRLAFSITCLRSQSREAGEARLDAWSSNHSEKMGLWVGNSGVLHA